MDVENNLKECRQEKGVSQQDVASATHVDKRSIMRYEQGGVPSLATALRLSSYYDKTVNEIFKVVEE